jgi:nicotinate-nucleotide pyrophosphorylase (carboxylating)
VQNQIEKLVRESLSEDAGAIGDVTSQLVIPESSESTAKIVARQDGIFAGTEVISAFVEIGIDGPKGIAYQVVDGDSFSEGEELASIKASTRDILTIERPLLNMLCHLCGIATETRKWVEAVAGTNAVIRDTRKTLPGLRVLQKYAVKCGGGENHRMTLSDAILIKDNHIAAVGSIAKALEDVSGSDLPVEIEVDSLEQLREAIEAGAPVVLLDNMGLDEITKAVALRNEMNPKTKLEASGGINLDNARAIAQAGVDYLAIGALTHSVKACDLAIDFQ